MKKLCSNMNHGRINAPVRHCPSCGENVNIKVLVRCDSSKHISLRKSRLSFCTDCGKKL